MQIQTVYYMRYIDIDDFRIFEDGSMTNLKTFRKYSPCMKKQIMLPNKQSFIIPVARLLLAAFKPLPEDLQKYGDRAWAVKIDKYNESFGIDNLKWDFPVDVKKQLSPELLKKYSLNMDSVYDAPKEEYYVIYNPGYYETYTSKEFADRFGKPLYTSKVPYSFTTYLGQRLTVSRDIPE